MEGELVVFVAVLATVWNVFKNLPSLNDICFFPDAE
jgi:hypothetical protein